MSSNDQGPVLIFGATGRHGGTGARVIERLKAAGRSVRAVVRTDDERAEQLRQSGVRTRVGNMHDRRTLVPALEGVSSVYVAYPVAAGVALALANVASVIHELGSSPHVVVNSHGTVALNSPSGISREFAIRGRVVGAPRDKCHGAASQRVLLRERAAGALGHDPRDRRVRQLLRRQPPAMD